jgi:hypothetical protein
VGIDFIKRGVVGERYHEDLVKDLAAQLNPAEGEAAFGVRTQKPG